MSTYVYGFTQTTHPLAINDLLGVGSKRLRVLSSVGLAAVVSDAPEGLRAKRRDLEAHEAVLEALSAAGTVLPMRFGTVAPRDVAVVTELEANAPRYRQLVSKLAGRVELNVKAIHREDAVLSELLQRDRSLRERNQALRTRGGGSYDEKVEFGEAVAAALEERRAQDAAVVVAALRPYAAQVSVGPAVDGSFVNVSFLVAAVDRTRFDASVSELGRELSGIADVHCYGPLPPYSFVGVGAAAA
jgi:Gas vesicle synthesis protein GvpL/GvpF